MSSFFPGRCCVTTSPIVTNRHPLAIPRGSTSTTRSLIQWYVNDMTMWNHIKSDYINVKSYIDSMIYQWFSQPEHCPWKTQLTVAVGQCGAGSELPSSLRRPVRTKCWHQESREKLIPQFARELSCCLCLRCHFSEAFILARNSHIVLIKRQKGDEDKNSC